MKPLTLDKIQLLISRLVGKNASDLDNYFYPAQPKHISKIVEMRQRILSNVSQEEDSRYIQWRYNFGLYDSFDNALNETRMWVFEIDEEILSVVGVHAVALQCEGSILNSVATMDLLAPKKHEGKGLGAWINLKLQSFGRPVLAMGSNVNSASMVTKLYQPMPHRNIYRKILASPNYFSKLFKNTKLGLLASFFYQQYLKLALALKCSGWDKEFTLRQIPRFNDNHATLIEEICMARISVKRTLDSLNWRLFDFPKEEALVYGIYSKEKLLGYIALLVSKSKTESTATIIDWGFLQKEISQSNFSIAITKIQLLLLKNKIGDITAYAYDKNSAEIFKRSGIHYRDDKSKTLSIFIPSTEGYQKLNDFDSWFLTGFDADDV